MDCDRFRIGARLDYDRLGIGGRLRLRPGVGGEGRARLDCDRNWLVESWLRTGRLEFTEVEVCKRS